MRKTVVLFLLLFFGTSAYSQDLPDLPIPMGAGAAVVWRNHIYHFGGSNNWSGSVCYPRIYKFDGFTWSYHDSIPDYNMWDPKAILLGNDVYLIGGWPSGASYTRRYSMETGDWTYLTASPNTQSWGITASYFNGVIYLFDSYGNTYAYSVGLNNWESKPNNSTTANWDLSSVLYKNEIYVIGYVDTAFYKYSPQTGEWTRLKNSPYPVGGCAMGVINDSIYCVGGNMSGGTGANYHSAIVYDVPSDTWTLSNTRLSSKRHWMATVHYAGGLYVVGGLDSASYAVSTVEEIVPQGTSLNVTEEFLSPADYGLYQNYPNPFNPNTTIAFSLAQQEQVTLTIFDLLGKEIATLVSEKLAPGTYSYQWQSGSHASGVYYYKLTTPDFSAVKKMVLVR